MNKVSVHLEKHAKRKKFLIHLFFLKQNRGHLIIAPIKKVAR